MATKYEIRKWCYKLGEGRLEQSGVQVTVAVKTQPAGFSGFEIRLDQEGGGEAVFDLLEKDAERCIKQGACNRWKTQLNYAINTALSGVGPTVGPKIPPPSSFGIEE